jgi:stage IV sporulation protein FB
LRAGRVAGVQLILNNWFLALIALFSLVGMGGKVFLVFTAVLWHEIAHAVTAVYLGMKVREIELLPFGGVARIDGLTEAGTKKEAVIAAAGPAASLILAALVSPGIKSPYWGEVANFFIDVNVTLAVFNMLPALPLDGGRIVRAWMTVFLSYSQATLLMALITKTMTALMGIFIITQFIVDGTMHISLAVAGFFLYTAAQTELRVVRYRAMNVLSRKKAELTSRGVMPATHFTALAGTSVKKVIDLFGPDHYGVVMVLDEDCRMRGSLTETEIWEGLPEHGIHANISEFL